MSYAFTMRFAQVKDKAEAFDLCCKVTDSLCSVSEAERYAISQYQYARWSIFGDKKPEKEFLNLWVKNLLIVRFVFWPEENILALVGDYPDTIASNFGPAIHFQNGTDQDYEFEVWGNNIRLFNYLKKVAQRLSEKAVEDELGTEPASSEYGVGQPCIAWCSKTWSLRNGSMAGAETS